MHGRCSTVNINSDNHNSDLKEDVTYPFNNFLNSTNFACLVNNAIVFINADITQQNFVLRKKSSLFIMFRKGFMKIVVHIFTVIIFIVSVNKILRYGKVLENIILIQKKFQI